MERPILFSGPMIRAILEGKKTQTRRVMKPQPVYDPELSKKVHTFGSDKGGWSWKAKNKGCWYFWDGWTGFDCRIYLDGPYQPEQLLWVRETWKPALSGGVAYYKATFDSAIADAPNIGWKPSIYMPRWASRLTLEVTGVRVEQVQSISEDDALAEGVEAWAKAYCSRNPEDQLDPVEYFGLLWNSINQAKGYGWENDPWVWVVEFRKIEP